MKPDKIRCGIFTSNRYEAKIILDEIASNNKDNIEFYRNSSIELDLRLKDGTDYIWLRPSDSSRGFRCSKAIIDLAIDSKIIRELIMPICIYCEEKDYKTFNTNRKDEFMKIADLIEELKSLASIYGNKPIAINDNDGLLFPITDVSYEKVPCGIDESRNYTYDYGFAIN